MEKKYERLRADVLDEIEAIEEVIRDCDGRTPCPCPFRACP